MNSPLPAMGQTVRFRGGTGRNDGETIHEGIVNGPPQHFQRERVTYIPVHMRDENHNVMVETTNLVNDDD